MLLMDWLVIPTLVLAWLGIGWLVFARRQEARASVDSAVIAPRGTVLVKGLSHPVRFRYRLPTGRSFEREASVGRVEEYRGRLYLLAMDEERDRFRMFRSDRIEALTDLETGEVAADPEAWLRRLAAAR